MITLVPVLLLAFLSAADEIELENGRVLEGKVEDLGDSIRLTRSGSSVTYPKHMVRRIEYRKTPEEVYADKARELKDGDLEGHLKLGRWCLEKKLSAEAALEFRKVVAVDPDHGEARTALGHRLHQGQWMTEEQVNEAKGLVKHKGRWMTPEERDLESALDEQKDLDLKLLREVRVQLDRLRSSDEKKREEARDALQGIDDKHKVKMYLAALSTGSKEVRGHVIGELGRMKTPAAAKPLARRVVWDDEVPFRALALRSLEAIGHPDTALFLAVYLAEESVSARIRAEEAMGLFKDPRAVPVLLEALENAIETARAMEQYGEQIATVVNRTMILRDGTRVTLPKVVRVRAEAFDRQSRDKLLQEKAAILSTLGAVTGQGFGEDLARWREWMKKQK
jgi:hypothetical protein